MAALHGPNAPLWTGGGPGGPTRSGRTALWRRTLDRPVDPVYYARVQVGGLEGALACGQADPSVAPQAEVWPAVSDLLLSVIQGLPEDEVLRLLAAEARRLASADLAWVGGVSSDVPPPAAVRGVGPLFQVRMVGEGPERVLSVTRYAGRPAFSLGELAAVRALAEHVGRAMECERTRRGLERLSVVEERERIAADLHDGVAQMLFVVGLILQEAQEAVHQPDRLRVHLAEALGHVDSSIRDLRHVLFPEPQPPSPSRLSEMLFEVTRAFNLCGRARVSFEVDPGAAALLEARGRCSDVVRAAREAIANAVRHSGAETVQLRLSQEGSDLVLEVVDDGVGFDPGSVPRGAGLGTLPARAVVMAGSCQVETGPGAGTRVRISVPVAGEGTVVG